MNKTIECVKPQWMVLARHFAMPGGVSDYGTADIKDFFDTPKGADEYAEKLFDRTQSGLTLPVVWVLRCEKTYKADISHGDTVVIVSEELPLEAVSRVRAEQAVPLCDCSGREYTPEEREDIIRYFLLGAEIQRGAEGV